MFGGGLAAGAVPPFNLGCQVRIRCFYICVECGGLGEGLGLQVFCSSSSHTVPVFCCFFLAISWIR